ncbi:hypothetical protein BGW36DRAFT_178409 [Talaromyces proteolyticus]|uniref:Uncharacterized protein n=1 Tax=Talaromyces proteolyticus TaxID=1131652 RepID=A0AAD4PUZ8_9EURO|nr:uncharacterized protein BGW36DRAFT_178409 [Talaromyces proteolyticus]KAH8695930.1 hypothetical protein BGW36DRAFT_178409 [Talaromyces proteolyticus]
MQLDFIHRMRRLNTFLGLLTRCSGRDCFTHAGWGPWGKSTTPASEARRLGDETIATQLASVKRLRSSFLRIRDLVSHSTRSPCLEERSVRYDCPGKDIEFREYDNSSVFVQKENKSIPHLSSPANF